MEAEVPTVDCDLGKGNPAAPIILIIAGNTRMDGVRMSTGAWTSVWVFSQNISTLEFFSSSSPYCIYKIATI